MPLKKSSISANASATTLRPITTKIDKSSTAEISRTDNLTPPPDPMVARARSASGSPRDLVRLRAWRVDSPGELPQVTFDEAGGKLNMDNGLFTDVAPVDKQNYGSMRRPSPSLRPGLVSPIDEPANTGNWSSAVGHATTAGKSGRVIERLQGDIDRLNRDKIVWKARFEEAERTNETLSTRNTFLMDRNSNLEQSHELDIRQLARKERLIEDLREDLRKEKQRTAVAERTAQTASATEEEWRSEAAKAKAIAAQKEQEYDSIASCRNMDNERHQSALDRLRGNLGRLVEERKADLETQRRLEIVAEQQSQTIKQLEELNRKLTANNQAYRAEIDRALAGMLSRARERSDELDKAVDSMHEARDKMKWVISVKKNIPDAG